MHILVADADNADARLVGQVLSSGGHQVTQVQPDADTIWKLMVLEADALILEADPPGTESLQLCRRLRSMRFPGIIIFVSRNGSVAIKVKAFQAGADDYVVKPVAPVELLARIEAVARRIRATA